MEKATQLSMPAVGRQHAFLVKSPCSRRCGVGGYQNGTRTTSDRTLKPGSIIESEGMPAAQMIGFWAKEMMEGSQTDWVAT